MNITINHNKPFDVKITGAGEALPQYEMMQISYHYEASLMAEFLMENYPITDEEQAMDLGYEICDWKSNTEGCTESEAIEEILSRRTNFLN